MDPFDNLYDLACLHEIVYKLNARIQRLKTPIFWKNEAEKIRDFRMALYYEELRAEAYDAIEELCNIPKYDDSDDNFDDYESSDKDSDPHSP